MAYRHDPTDPANMTPDQRLAEMAAILAQGVLRLRRRAALPTQPPVTAPLPGAESEQISLDAGADLRLHGQRG